jgi:GT2 family glycosyltransferase
VLRAAVLPPAEAARAWEALRPQLVLDDLWDAEVHRLLPQVHANLRAAGVDDPDLRRLKGLHRRTWYENQVSLHRVRPGLEALVEAGVPLLFLKGVPLALHHYGDLGLRPMADIDVLVPWDDAAGALDVLEALGWSDVGGLTRTLLFLRYHGSGMQHPDGGQLDVHWHLGTPLLLPEDERASNDDFWAAAVPFAVPDHGIDALTLCPTDMLLHVIAHGLWAGSGSTVRWVADAHVVIGDGTGIDWTRLRDQATKRRIAPLVADALRYLAEQLDAPVPSDVITDLGTTPATRRERRLLRALTGPVQGPKVLGGLPHLRAYWAYTRLKWAPGQAARELPRFVADLWGLERPRQIPRAAGRRAVHRLRGRPELIPRGAARMRRPDIAVVVPTHFRPEHLERCLRALDAQVECPAEVIVVRSSEDHEAGRIVAAHAGRVVDLVVPHPQQSRRLHAGAARARAEVVAFTDDDACPHPDWTRRIAEHFTDPSIGAVGGRDIVPGSGPPAARDVGRIGFGGRLVGGHSDGVGPARDVDHLRGVNMAFRRHLLRSPVGLRGPGAEGCNELAPCLAVLAAGRRVVYDPELCVDHDHAPRYEHGDGNRVHAATAKRVDDAFNQTYTLLSLRPGRVRRMLYVVLIGDRSTGGLARCAWAALRGDRRLAGELRPLLRAHLDAWREARRRPLRVVAPDEPYPVG